MGSSPQNGKGQCGFCFQKKNNNNKKQVQNYCPISLLPVSSKIFERLLYDCMFTLKKNNNFMAPFCGWGSTASRLEPFRGSSLLLTTKFPEISGTHFINLERIKGWVNLGATRWFWTQDPWIVNPVPWQLYHCSNFTENSLIFQNHSGFKPGDSCTN